MNGERQSFHSIVAPKKSESKCRRVTFEWKMIDERLNLEELQSLKEITEKISTSPNRDHVCTMSIKSCKFSLPQPGSPTIFEDKFPNLEHLQINNNQLNRLVSGAFYNLENLRYLELKNNVIEEIEEGAFSDLPSLFSLIISNNNIHTITNGAFEGLDRLGNLILNSNGTVTVEKDVFRHLRSLYNLEFTHNVISILDETQFDDLENLGHLILKNNKLQEIPAGIFSSLKRLRHLDVSRNKIVSLPPNLLSGYVMDVVNFSNNKIESIEESTLQGLNLGTGVLELGHNELKVLSHGTLSVIARKVVLSNNQIDTIEPSAFEGCDCDKLYLNENALIELNSDSFKGLQVRHRLCLSGNKIESLETPFTNCSELQRLDLDGNSLGDIPSGIFEGLENLIVLNLDGNAIVRLGEDTFAGLPKLVGLYLQNNQIEEVHQNCFSSHPDLTSLVLNSNNLVSLPDEIFRGLDLWELDLGHNEFTELPLNTLYHSLPHLCKANFSHNKIKKILTGSFRSESTEKDFQEIYLHSNEISVIEEGAFEGIERVKLLTLSSNELFTIPPGCFQGLGSIDKLVLDENAIDCMDSLKELPLTGIVSLAGNPLEDVVIDLETGTTNLGNIRAISFTNHSYRKEGDAWSSVDRRIEELEEQS